MTLETLSLNITEGDLRDVIGCVRLAVAMTGVVLRRKLIPRLDISTYRYG